jgi:hypothetical protein
MALRKVPLRIFDFCGAAMVAHHIEQCPANHAVSDQSTDVVTPPPPKDRCVMSPLNLKDSIKARAPGMRPKGSTKCRGAVELHLTC